ncbi:MAG: DEAD/DEAH box helicase [Syntrophus sp. (in: bacteria)]
MKIILTNNLQISEVPEMLLQKIRSTFTIENPRWLDNVKMSRWQGKTDHWLTFFKKRSGGLAIPRGAMGLILFFCKEAGIKYEIIDKRRKLPSVNFTFKGTLKGYQKRAVRDILIRDFNVLQAGTGTGKTIIALYVITERKQPVLIIVHSKELLAQWINRIEQFLDIPRDEIGIIGNGKKRIGEKITVGIINSIYPIAEEIKDFFGHIVVDECHRTPSRTFTEAVSAFDCQYMLGLSATPYRRDGLTNLIGWYLGRQVKVRESELTGNDVIQNVEVIIRKTDFQTDLDASEEYSRMLSELTEDGDRNRLIVEDVIAEASNSGGICLVLSDRKEHCRSLQNMLSKQGLNADVMTGELSNGERQAIVGRLSAGMVQILIATGQLIGEGFDAKSLQTLFLTTPIKFDGRLFQYLGRVIRPAQGKDYARIYDYIDANVGVLAASAQARQKVYQQIIGCK